MSTRDVQVLKEIGISGRDMCTIIHLYQYQITTRVHIQESELIHMEKELQ